MTRVKNGHLTLKVATPVRQVWVNMYKTQVVANKGIVNHQLWWIPRLIKEVEDILEGPKLQTMPGKTKARQCHKDRKSQDTRYRYLVL